MSFNCISLSASLEDLKKQKFKRITPELFDFEVEKVSLENLKEVFHSYVSLLCFYENFLNRFSDSHDDIQNVNPQFFKNALSLSFYPIYDSAFSNYELLCDCILILLSKNPSLIDCYPDNSQQKSLLCFLLQTKEDDSFFDDLDNE